MSVLSRNIHQYELQLYKTASTTNAQVHLFFTVTNFSTELSEGERVSEQEFSVPLDTANSSFWRHVSCSGIQNQTRNLKKPHNQPLDRLVIVHKH